MNEESKQEKPGPAQQAAGPGYLEVIMIALLASVITAVIVVGLYDRWYAVKVVTVDLQGFVMEQRDLAANGRLDDEGLAAAFERLDAALAAEPANHVIVTKDVVIRNALEIKP